MNHKHKPRNKKSKDALYKLYTHIFNMVFILPFYFQFGVLCVFRAQFTFPGIQVCNRKV